MLYKIKTIWLWKIIKLSLTNLYKVQVIYYSLLRLFTNNMLESNKILFLDFAKVSAISLAASILYNVKYAGFSFTALPINLILSTSASAEMIADFLIYFAFCTIYFILSAVC